MGQVDDIGIGGSAKRLHQVAVMVKAAQEGADIGERRSLAHGAQVGDDGVQEIAGGLVKDNVFGSGGRD